MNTNLIRRQVDAEAVKAAIRKRHNLADDAPVELKSMPMSVKMLDSHTFRARITTDSLDRDSEVVIPQGLDATSFEKAGTIFWNHNYDVPLAKNIKLTRGKNFIDATAEFAHRPGDYVGEFFPDFARAMVSQGIVKGVSIGFMAKETRNPSKKDVEEWGDELRRVISKSSLFEWSIAPVQSNPDALILEATAKGILTESDDIPETKDGDLAVETPKTDEKPPENDEKSAEDAAPMTAACKSCGNEYDISEMQMTEGEDGAASSYICKECAKSGAAPMPATETPSPEKAAPQRHVVRTIETDEPKEVIAIKRVHRVLDEDAPKKTPVKKLVMAEVRKRQGYIY
jgi:hypothetical protein